MKELTMSIFACADFLCCKTHGAPIETSDKKKKMSVYCHLTLEELLVEVDLTKKKKNSLHVVMGLSFWDSHVQKGRKEALVC